MAIARDHWIRHRPFLYHFAPIANIERIIKRGEMLSAQAIVWKAHAYDPTQVPDPGAFLRTPRDRQVTLTTGPLPEDVFILNDQLPMVRESSFAGLDGTRDEFVAMLNNFVFYWPGKMDGPVTRGRHGQTFRRKYNEFAELRIPVADLWTDSLNPKFCRYNSGGPQARDRVIRGAGIFVPASEQELLTAKVVETVFDQPIDLPPSTQWRMDAVNSWQTNATT